MNFLTKIGKKGRIIKYSKGYVEGRNKMKDFQNKKSN